MSNSEKLRAALFKKIDQLKSKLSPEHQFELSDIVIDLHEYLKTEVQEWNAMMDEVDKKLACLNYLVGHTNERQETIADKLSELEAVLDQLK